MASDSVRPSSIPSQAKAELELIEFIFSPYATAYPWNPADPEVWAYCEALEQEIADTWSVADFEPYVQTFSKQLDRAWEAFPVQRWSAVFPTELFQRFSAQIPTHLLESIVHQAQQAIAQQQTLAEQLVVCVRDLLPAWTDDDLQVLARPFAYAMRSGADSEMLEGTLQSIRCASWADLSEIEQARLSLAIARYVLSQQSAPDA